MSYIYADDASISISGKSKEETIANIKDSLGVLVKRFGDNSMKVNVSKFQFPLLCPTRNENTMDHFIQTGDIILKSQQRAKLLGVIIDCDLNFNVHIKKKCGKANAKLQALRL